MSGLSRIDTYRSLAARGLTISEAARQCGVSHQAVCRAARRHHIRFALGVGRPGPEIWTPERRARQAEAMRAWWVGQRA